MVLSNPAAAAAAAPLASHVAIAAAAAAVAGADGRSLAARIFAAPRALLQRSSVFGDTAASCAERRAAGARLFVSVHRRPPSGMHYAET